MKTWPFPKRLRRLWEARSARDKRILLALGALLASYLLGEMSRTSGATFVLGFFALVPWLLALDRAERRADQLLAGLLMSASFVAFVFPWFPGAVASYSGGSTFFAWVLLLAFAPLLEPQFVAFALIRGSVRRDDFPASMLASAAAAAVYVGIELLGGKLFFDTLGLGLHPSPSFRQAAELAGAHGLTLFLLLVNECLAMALSRLAREPRAAFARAARPLGVAALAVLVCFAYGRARLSALDAHSPRPPITVGIVQANITNYEKLRAEKGAFDTVREILDTHFALTGELRARARPDVLLWPETVYPTTFGAARSEDGAAFDAEIERFVEKNGVPLVFGAYEREGDAEYNAAFFLSPGSSGHVERASYKKRMLFPFTEWVPEPLDSPWLRESLPWTGHWKRGPGASVVRLGSSGPNVAPLICYDVLFPELVADAARKGAELIVTLSNDSWFPDGRAPRLHLISAAFRSIETRLPQVRATNSGISAIIDAKGEILARTRWGERATLDGMLFLEKPAATPMVKYGHLRAPVMLGAAALFGFFAWKLRRAGERARSPGSARNKRRPR